MKCGPRNMRPERDTVRALPASVIMPGLAPFVATVVLVLLTLGWRFIVEASLGRANGGRRRSDRRPVRAEVARGGRCPLDQVNDEDGRPALQDPRDGRERD